MPMTSRERFRRLMNFEAIDRLPIIEWAHWWDKTIARWKQEGLPKELTEAEEISESLGLDIYRQYWFRPMKVTFPKTEVYGKGMVSDMDSYIQAKKELYPEEHFDREIVEKLTVQQKMKDAVIWITLDGFFWFPRTLFGIEEHLYAFYDNRQEIMHVMNQDLLNYNLHVIDRFCKILKPDFMTFAEDMSYNYGPMISKPHFDEFIKPYYEQIIPRFKEYGIITFIDTDGNIEELVSWFTDLGVEGFLPLERQSGVDIIKLRKLYPQLKMIGGYDKMVMSKGESEMRREFERIMPVMREGGYIPSVDHQTPPEVSFENYKIYLRLLREYSEEAIK